MKLFKLCLAALLLSTQGLVFLGFFVEFWIRGFQLPIVCGSLYLLRIAAMSVMRDSSGEVLFSLNRLSRFGPIYYFSFDLLKRI